MNRRIFLAAAVALVMAGCFIYYRRHHYAKAPPIFRPPQNPFRNTQNAKRPSNPSAPEESRLSNHPPPNQIRSADLERTLQTLQEINRINKLNAEQQKKPVSSKK